MKKVIGEGQVETPPCEKSANMMTHQINTNEMKWLSNPITLWFVDSSSLISHFFPVNSLKQSGITVHSVQHIPSFLAAKETLYSLNTVNELNISFRLVVKFRRDYLASAQSTQDIQACKKLPALSRTISSASSADRLSNSDSSQTARYKPAGASGMQAHQNVVKNRSHISSEICNVSPPSTFLATLLTCILLHITAIIHACGHSEDNRTIQKCPLLYFQFCNN